MSNSTAIRNAGLFKKDAKSLALSKEEVEKLVPGFAASTGTWDCYSTFVIPADEKCKRGSKLVVEIDGIFVLAVVTSKSDNPFTGDPDIRVKIGSWTIRISGCYKYALVK